MRHLKCLPILKVVGSVYKMSEGIKKISITAGWDVLDKEERLEQMKVAAEEEAGEKVEVVFKTATVLNHWLRS